MKVFYAEHSGIWMGGFTVITAPDRENAEYQLVQLLRDNGLSVDGYSLTEVDATKQGATMVWNGDY